MGMVKIQPPKNPNPSTDYDKTLHSWLCLWDKLVTQIWYKSVVRERLANYVKYTASLFYFYFFQRLAYWSDPSANGEPQEAYSLGGATGEEVVYIVY